MQAPTQSIRCLIIRYDSKRQHRFIVNDILMMISNVKQSIKLAKITKKQNWPRLPSNWSSIFSSAPQKQTNTNTYHWTNYQSDRNTNKCSRHTGPFRWNVKSDTIIKNHFFLSSCLSLFKTLLVTPTTDNFTFLIYEETCLLFD